MLLRQLDRFPIDKIEKTGSLENWSAVANKLFAPQCEGQAIAMLASFASVLMPLHKAKNEAGAVVSIYGPRRSGKSIAGVAAASVWGVPLKLHVEHSTIGADKFTMFTELGNLPALHDSLLHYDPSRTCNMLCDLTFGWYGKEQFWDGLLIATNPIPLFPVIEGLKRQHPILGIERKVSVPIAMQIKGLEYEFASNAGQAAIPYLRYLSKPEVQRWARQEIVSRSVELKETFKLGDALRFPMRAVSAIAVASTIVTKLGILDFDIDRVNAALAWEAFHAVHSDTRPDPDPQLPSASTES